jgi:hypothetical protein
MSVFPANDLFDLVINISLEKLGNNKKRGGKEPVGIL